MRYSCPSDINTYPQTNAGFSRLYTTWKTIFGRTQYLAEIYGMYAGLGMSSMIYFLRPLQPLSRTVTRRQPWSGYNKSQVSSRRVKSNSMESDGQNYYQRRPARDMTLQSPYEKSASQGGHEPSLMSGKSSTIALLLRSAGNHPHCSLPPPTNHQHTKLTKWIQYTRTKTSSCNPLFRPPPVSSNKHKNARAKARTRRLKLRKLQNIILLCR